MNQILCQFLIVSVLFISCQSKVKESQHTNTMSDQTKTSPVDTRYTIHKRTQEFVADAHTFGLWHFSEKKSRFVFDLSPNEHDVQLSKKKQWDVGLLNTGYLFDGRISGFIKYMPNQSKPPIKDALTIDIILLLNATQPKGILPILTKTVGRANDSNWIYRLILVNGSPEKKENYPTPTKTIYWQIKHNSKVYQVYLNHDLEKIKKRWLYLSATYTKDNIKLYLNGILQQTIKLPNVTINDEKIQNEQNYLVIGKPYNAKTSANMVVDELHVSAIERSKDNIKTYATQLKNTHPLFDIK